jgi:hypothetical protein
MSIMASKDEKHQGVVADTQLASPDNTMGVSQRFSTKGGSDGSEGEHVFSDPTVEAYWRSVYDDAKYESRHRFDPTLTWSAQSERLLKKKVDPIYLC